MRVNLPTDEPTIIIFPFFVINGVILGEGEEIYFNNMNYLFTFYVNAKVEKKFVPTV